MSDNEDKITKDSEGKDEGSKREPVSEKSGLAAGIEALTSFIADKLSLTDDEPDVKKGPNIDSIVDLIKSKKCKKILTMVGAGISTAAGIPDFRSPGSGLYHNLSKFDLPTPEAIFYLDYFNHDAKPFFTLAKDLYPGTFKPTKSHYFIKLLEEKGLLLRHYTQNIDTLERVAGIDENLLVEAHGTFHTGHCMGCRHEYSQQWMKEYIFRDEIPICEDCPGVVKPDIVFFGENLPDKFYQYMQTDFKKCDLLIIMGSSLSVQPFASLVDRVPRSCRRLFINREEAGNFKADNPKNVRDVLMLGDCDEQCQILADKLGWGDELKDLLEKEHKRINDEEKTEKPKKNPKCD